MESEHGADAAALHDAERARDEMAASVVFPRGHDAAIGAAVAVQIATTAVVPFLDEGWATWALLAGGVVLFGMVAGLQLWRFSRLNGVRVRGFAGRVIGGTAVMASVGYAVSLAVAFAAAAQELWWLTGLAALAGGLAYVLSGRRWLRAYRREPARLGAGESALVLTVLVLAAVAALVLLVLER